MQTNKHTHTARDPAVPAAGVLQGVPDEAGGGGRRRAGALHPQRRAVHRQCRRQRLRAELLHKPAAVQDADGRPVLRPPRGHLRPHRAGALRHGGAPRRRHVAAAAGLPAGVHHAVRARRRRVRVQAQQRRAELQPEDERHRGRAGAAVPGPQDRRLRHLHAAVRPGHGPPVAGLRGGPAGMLRDGHGGDHRAPLQPQVRRDVPQRHVLRLLGRRPPVRGGQPGHR
uniref:Uncharacterized protein n=1 Tax=Zea mays TaxID=4577 RepID=B4FJH3_MAIZE|nr:unknown [Zea mays]ACL52868.1 unknown [Zea mays]